MELKDCRHGAGSMCDTSTREESRKKLDEELDLLPEHCIYRDEGCEFAVSCLECPFVRCVLEQWGGKRRWHIVYRDREIARLFKIEGKSTAELAKKFGINQRSVQRILRRANNE